MTFDGVDIYFGGLENQLVFEEFANRVQRLTEFKHNLHVQEDKFANTLKYVTKQQDPSGLSIILHHFGWCSEPVVKQFKKYKIFTAGKPIYLADLTFEKRTSLYGNKTKYLGVKMATDCPLLLGNRSMFESRSRLSITACLKPGFNYSIKANTVLSTREIMDKFPGKIFFDMLRAYYATEVNKTDCETCLV